MTVEAVLQQFGLSETESALYTHLLHSVETTAFAASQDTGIPRTTVYKTLESMKHQGLVQSYQKNGVLHYTAESPQRLFEVAKQKTALIESALPEMFALIQKSGITPKTKLYTGKESMKIVWDDVLETMQKQKIKQLYAISHPMIYQVLPKYFPKWVEKRVSLGVVAKIIFPDIPESYKLANQALREVRYLPKNFPYQCTVDIYGDKLAFFSLKENETTSIILESPAISEMFRQFFLFAWQLVEAD